MCILVHQALAEEKEAYERSANKKIYLNIAVHRITKLRHEAALPSPVKSPSSAGARSLSHQAVLGGAKAQAQNFTIKRSAPYMARNKELSGEC